MKTCHRIFLLTASIMLIAAGAFAANILTNGDFETGDLTAWEAYGLSGMSTITIEMGNGPSVPGNYSAFLSNEASAVGLGIKQVTSVGSAAEGNVEWSFDLLLDQADVGGVFFAEIFAEQEGVGIIGGSGLQGPFWAWEWTNYSGSFMAPANTDFMTFQFTATTGAAQGSNCIAHLDNVVLEQPGVVATESSSLDQVKALFR